MQWDNSPTDTRWHQRYICHYTVFNNEPNSYRIVMCKKTRNANRKSNQKRKLTTWYMNKTINENQLWHVYRNKGQQLNDTLLTCDMLIQNVAEYVWWRKTRPLNWDRIVTGQDKSKLYKSIEKVLTHQIDTKQTHNLQKYRSGVVEQTTTKKLLSRDLRVFYLLAPSLKQTTIIREKAFKVIKTFSYGVIHV